MFGTDHGAEAVAFARPAARLRQALGLLRKQRRAAWARPTSEEVVHDNDHCRRYLAPTYPVVIRLRPTNWLMPAKCVRVFRMPPRRPSRRLPHGRHMRRPRVGGGLAAEIADRDAELPSLVGQVGLDARVGKDDDAYRKRRQHG